MQDKSFQTTSVALSLFLFAAGSWAQSAEGNRPSPIDRIYAEDQQVRQAPNPNAPKPVYSSDDERLAATRKLLARGELHAGKDYEKAAFIFQHSHQPDDYLVAHTLAVIAIAKDDQDAIWIASASLDRYLSSVGKPQIYGTQFHTPPGGPATQEPYNRTLISDALRADLKIPSQAEQQKRLEEDQRESMKR